MLSSVLPIAAWSQYPWLRAGFSTRLGGVSTVYGDEAAPGSNLGLALNLGWTKEDAPANVAENRRRFLAEVALELPSESLVTMRQVHGSLVRIVVSGEGPLSTYEGRAILECDGLTTDAAGLPLGVQTADCVPVLLADTRTHAVAALHAGWRGTLAGIAGEGVAVMKSAFGSRPQDLIAAIGPAILPCCFQVGAEVREHFVRDYTYASELFTEVEGKPHLDLHAANRRQLLDAGLTADAITLLGECSACARSVEGHRRYFSHRAEKGITGRMMAVIASV